ncbi:MAG TPA: septal ring lytic transglycosylase RlpA family protein [Candidatus Cloacimonadota bacterium]|nr:septal ring lytic transglycosylase RlpA family protein [Candidatus Cloacimonadota bacterium]
MFKKLSMLLLGAFTMAAASLCTSPAQTVDQSSNTTRQNELSQRELQGELVEEPPSDSVQTFTMKATYYANCLHGRRTTSGEIYNKNKLTCAHRKLPFNTLLKITNKDNGKEVIVRVNDRGPFVRSMDLDLSRAAAEQLGMIRAGVKHVQVQVLGVESPKLAESRR